MGPDGRLQLVPDTQPLPQLPNIPGGMEIGAPQNAPPSFGPAMVPGGAYGQPKAVAFPPTLIPHVLDHFARLNQPVFGMGGLGSAGNQPGVGPAPLPDFSQAVPMPGVQASGQNDPRSASGVLLDGFMNPLPPQMESLGPDGEIVRQPGAPTARGDLQYRDFAKRETTNGTRGQPAPDGNMIICPPAPFTITGIGPHQANGSAKASYSQIPGNLLPNGAVAVNPQTFGVSPRADGSVPGAIKNVLAQIKLEPDWSAAVPPNGYTPAIPLGLPSMGPYSVMDAISPPTTDDRIDLYRYSSNKNAYASTRPNIPVVASIPKNDVGVVCPDPRRKRPY